MVELSNTAELSQELQHAAGDTELVKLLLLIEIRDALRELNRNPDRPDGLIYYTR